MTAKVGRTIPIAGLGITATGAVIHGNTAATGTATAGIIKTIGPMIGHPARTAATCLTAGRTIGPMIGRMAHGMNGATDLFG